MDAYHSDRGGCKRGEEFMHLHTEHTERLHSAMQAVRPYPRVLYAVLSVNKAAKNIINSSTRALQLY